LRVEDLKTRRAEDLKVGDWRLEVEGGRWMRPVFAGTTCRMAHSSFLISHLLNITAPKRIRRQICDLSGGSA